MGVSRGIGPRPVPVDDRAVSGIEGLDRVLLGGFPRGNSILLQGPPGSAKTTVGLQTLINGATRFGENGIVLSFEQEPAQLFRDASGFGWDLERLHEGRRIRILCLSPQDLYQSLTSEDSNAIGEVRRLQSEIGAQRILVDSISHFFRTNHPSDEQDRTFYGFLSTLRGFGLTPLLTAEEFDADAHDRSRAEYVVDTVIHLHYDYTPQPAGPRRWLEVVKSRGQRFLEGCHPFRFTSHGIEVFPQIMPEPYTMEIPLAGGRDLCSTGVAGLDEMLSGGLRRGSVAIVAGMEGVGKTTVGAHFIRAGRQAGETGLALTFQESPRQLIDDMSARGIDVARDLAEGRLQILHVASMGAPVMEIYYQLAERIESHGVRRVVVDGLNDIRRCAHDEVEERYFLSLFCDLFRRHQVTAVLLEQARHSHGLEALAQIEHASLVDVVIFMGLSEIEGRLAKIISVLKSRGAPPATDIREVLTTPAGLVVRKTFRSLGGILEGASLHEGRKRVEEAARRVAAVRLMLADGGGPHALSAAQSAAVDSCLSDLERELQVDWRDEEGKTEEGRE